MKTEHTNSELVIALKNGSIDAFEKLFYKYNKKLYYFAKGYLGIKEDAEGLVQEVFITIWEKRHELDDELSFNSYIFTIAYRSILKYFRTKSREEKYLNSLLTDYSENSEETEATTLDIEYDDLREILDEAIEELPDKRKEVFKLSRLEGLSNVEIAKKLNLSKRTVETHLYLAIKTLRKNFNYNSIVILYFYLFVK